MLLRVNGIQVCSNEGPRPFPSGDNYEKAKIHWQSENVIILKIFKNLLLQNHCANFNQTWYKASLGEGNLILFKWMTIPFYQGEIIKKNQKYIDENKKKSSSQELLDQCQSILLHSFLGWRGFKFVQIMGPALFQGEIITKYQKYIDEI